MIISFANQKGGVAKTTSTFNIATSLISKKRKVLMIDLDPQASLTIFANIEPYSVDYSIVDVLKKPDFNIKRSIITLRDNLDIIPSRIELAALESELLGRTARELILNRAIKDILTEYDFILIDCPPQLSTLTINALAASSHVIIPCKTDYLAYRGIDQLLETIDSIKNYFNPSLSVIGVLATMFESRANDDNDVLNLLKDEYDLIGTVKRTVKAKEGIYEGKTAFEVDSTNNFSKEYAKIANTILELK